MATSRTETPSTPVVIYGAGGFAREVAWLAESIGGSSSVHCFIDDAADGRDRSLNDIPVLTLEQARVRYPRAAFVVGTGAPAVRERLAAKAVDAGFRPSTLVHPSVELSRWVEIGEGTVICAGSILTTNITLGRHVQINLDCTIGHDAVLEDYVTLTPGVHVSGWVRLERGAYIGTGASLVNGTEAEPLVVGANAVIGAGAVVTKSIPAGSTAVGIPARPR